MKRRLVYKVLSFCLAFGVIGAMLGSPYLVSQQTSTQQIPPSTVPSAEAKQSHSRISGKPIRITVPSGGVDLLVQNGSYNASTNTWELSDDKAMYSDISVLPNNINGLTFIYGHGTDRVFGKIGNKNPPRGSEAYIYTDNGLVFTYGLKSVQNLKPHDTWILKDKQVGPPRLIIQTCTGQFSEWRTIFEYSFIKVGAST